MCNCLQAVDGGLEKGLRVASGFAFGPDGLQTVPAPLIVVITAEVKWPRAHQVKRVIPTYCPFCGKKYQEV